VTACDKVTSFLQGHDSESFYADAQLESAVGYQLTIIGEAVSHLSDNLKSRHPEIPWRDIVGFRNQAIHNYFGFNWDEAWETSSTEVPVLRNRIAEILLSEFPDP
jgi:uncharacterized protein with HEPN domain